MTGTIKQYLTIKQASKERKKRRGARTKSLKKYENVSNYRERE